MPQKKEKIAGYKKKKRCYYTCPCGNNTATASMPSLISDQYHLLCTNYSSIQVT